MLRKDTKTHEKEEREKHMDLSLATVRLLSEQVQKFSDKQHKTLSEGEKFIFQLSGYDSSKENNETFRSTPFYTHPGGYNMCISIHANGCGAGEGTHVSAFIEILNGLYDNQLPWPFLGTVVIEVLNQLEDCNHHKLVLKYEASSDMRVGNRPTHSISWMIHCTSECQ